MNSTDWDSNHLYFFQKIYDPNAVRVENRGEQIGHVKKEIAQKISGLLLKLEGKANIEATITNGGDGYNQSCIVKFSKI